VDWLLFRKTPKLLATPAEVTASIDGVPLAGSSRVAAPADVTSLIDGVPVAVVLTSTVTDGVAV